MPIDHPEIPPAYVQVIPEGAGWAGSQVITITKPIARSLTIGANIATVSSDGKVIVDWVAVEAAATDPLVNDFSKHIAQLLLAVRDKTYTQPGR